MLPLPWSWALTLVFAATGAYCAGQWIRAYAAGESSSAPPQLVHLAHAVMSLLMIAMIWRPADALGSRVQAALFGAFALILVWVLTSARGRLARGDLVAHIVMNVAMAWMLLAMPLLMGHQPGGSDGHSHHGGSSDAAPTSILPTPPWAEFLNIAMIAACVCVAIWWLVRLRHTVRRPAHSLCHALGAAGMASMLVLM